jgi:hypothetical protein
VLSRIAGSLERWPVSALCFVYLHTLASAFEHIKLGYAGMKLLRANLTFHLCSSSKLKSCARHISSHPISQSTLLTAITIKPPTEFPRIYA